MTYECLLDPIFDPKVGNIKYMTIFKSHSIWLFLLKALILFMISQVGHTKQIGVAGYLMGCWKPGGNWKPKRLLQT